MGAPRVGKSLRRVLLAAFVAVVAAMAAVSPSALAVGTASISGLVTSGVSTPLDGASVQLQTSLGAPVQQASADQSGAYAFANVDAGSYKVRASKWGANVVPRTMTITVTDGEVANLDIALAVGAQITGVVKGPDGAIIGASVSASPSGGGPGNGSATTQAGGVFTIVGLESGAWDLSVDASSSNHIGARISGVSTTLGSVRDVGEITLTRGRMISGVVRDEGGNAVPRASVDARADTDSSTPGGWASTTAADDGTFQLKALRDGAFTVTARPAWNSSDNLMARSTSATVLPGSDLTGVEVVLRRGAEVAGVVRDEGGSPVSGASVSANMSPYVSGAEGAWGSANTNPSGQYSILGLGTGSFAVTVDASSQGLMRRAISVDVVRGTTHSGRDITLRRGGSISGRVTSGGVPVSGAWVNANRNPYVFNGEGTYGSDSTGPDGTYTIQGLGTGSYDVRISPPSDANQIPRTLRGVSVTAPTESSGHDAQLQAGGSIEGIVTDGSRPLSGVSVSASAPSGMASDGFHGWATSGPDGRFAIRGLNTATFSLNFSSSNVNIVSRTRGGVSVTQGASTTVSETVMQPGGIVTGQVTDANSQGLAGVNVWAQRIPYSSAGGSWGNATTNANGTYRLQGLATGTFRLTFRKDGANLVGGALPSVIVTAGQTISGQDKALTVGGQLTGTVQNESNAFLSNICVSAYSTANATFGGDWGSATTNDGGTFTLSGLRTASYGVYLSPCWGNPGSYLPKYLPSVRATEGVNAGLGVISLAAAGRIAGTAVAEADGRGVNGACVMASPALAGADYSPGSYGWAMTDENGAFEIVGLKPGSFRVTVDATCAADASVNLARTQSAPIAVTAGDRATVSLRLSTGGRITGRAVARTGGSAVSEACVWAERTDPVTDEWVGGWAQTDASGNYALRGLANGRYRLTVSPCWGVTGNLTGVGFTGIDVVQGQDASAPLAELPEGATISGTLMGLDGTTPVVGACVYASSGSWDPFGGSWGYAQTGDGGRFEIVGLRGGSFSVGFHPCGADVMGQRATGVIARTVSTTVAEAGARDIGTQQLINAGGIKGAATHNGAGMQGVCVSAEPLTPGVLNWGWAITDDNGAYEMTGLEPGAFRLTFDECMGSTGLASEVLASVTVPEGDFTLNRNAAMSAASSIAGVVTNAAGDRLPNVCVNAFHRDQPTGQAQEPVASARTLEDGSYTLGGLKVAEGYRVGFIPCGTDASAYSTVWFDGVSDPANATIITPPSSATVTGKNAVLPPAPGAAGLASRHLGRAQAASASCTPMLFVGGDCSNPRSATSPAMSPRSEVALRFTHPALPVTAEVDPAMLTDTATVTLDGLTSANTNAPSPPTSQLSALTAFTEITLVQGGRSDSGGAWEPPLKLKIGLPRSSVGVANRDISVHERTPGGRWIALPDIGARQSQTLNQGEDAGYYLSGAGTGRKVVILSRHAMNVAAFRAITSSPGPGGGSGGGSGGGGGSSSGAPSSGGSAGASAGASPSRANGTPCAGLAAGAKAVCNARARMAAAVAACSARPKSKRAACIKKARAAGQRAIRVAQCQMKPKAKRAACLKATETAVATPQEARALTAPGAAALPWSVAPGLSPRQP
jgi:hypothetical protein